MPLHLNLVISICSRLSESWRNTPPICRSIWNLASWRLTLWPINRTTIMRSRGFRKQIVLVRWCLHMVLAWHMHLLNGGSWDLDLHIRMLLVRDILIQRNLNTSNSYILYIRFKILFLFWTVKVLSCLVHVITLRCTHQSNVLIRTATCRSCATLCSTVSVSFNTLNYISSFRIHLGKWIVHVYLSVLLLANDVIKCRIACINNCIIHALVLCTIHLWDTILCGLGYHQISLRWMTVSIESSIHKSCPFLKSITIHCWVKLDIWSCKSCWHVVDSFIIRLCSTFWSGWFWNVAIILILIQAKRIIWIFLNLIGMGSYRRRNSVYPIYHINLQS